MIVLQQTQLPVSVFSESITNVKIQLPSEVNWQSNLTEIYNVYNMSRRI